MITVGNPDGSRSALYSPAFPLFGGGIDAKGVGSSYALPRIPPLCGVVLTPSGDMATASAKAIFDADSTLMERALDRMGSKLAHLGSQFDGFKGFGAMGGVASFVENAWEKMAKNIEKGAALEIMHERTGAAVGDLYLLGKAFEKVGLSAEDVPTLIDKMQRALATGSASNVLEQLGLDAEKLRKTDAAEAVRTIGNALWKIPNAADRATAAMQVFGERGTTILPAFAHGRADAVFEKGRLAADVYERSAMKFSQVHEKMSALGGSLNTSWLLLTDHLAGVLLPILDTITGTVEWLNKNLLSAPEAMQKSVDATVQAMLVQVKDPELYVRTLLDAQRVKAAMPFADGDFSAMMDGISAKLMENPDVYAAEVDRIRQLRDSLDRKRSGDGAEGMNFGAASSMVVSALGRVGGNWGGGGSEDPMVGLAQEQVSIQGAMLGRLESIERNLASPDKTPAPRAVGYGR